MLPQAAQARKAIWEAINPHTGKRRIDEAFPKELRATTREQEMMIRFKTGSTWQVVGSDNYNSLVGSPPAGVTYSEWALANPSARAYLRPIIAENKGWQLFITTPRGKNHAYQTYEAATKTDRAFAQRITVRDTKVLSPEDLEVERLAYLADFGKEMGQALFDQEWMCSFDAAIMGAYYAAEFTDIDASKRITRVEHDPSYPVYTGWDLGFDDDTAIWFYQVIAGEVRILEYYYNSGKNIDHYCSQLLGVKVTIDIVNDKLVVRKGEDIDDLAHRRAYNHGLINVPHDAKAKTLAARGKSIQEQLAAVFGWDKVRVIPTLSLEDGIQAVRKMLPRTYFDESCEIEGISALRQYRREWDDEKKCFADKPVHDWTSHPADGLRTVAVAWRDNAPKKPEPGKPGNHRTVTLDELYKLQQSNKQSSRI
jgi:hypothetical protein